MRIFGFIISAAALHLVLLALSLDKSSETIDEFSVGVALVERQMDLFATHASTAGSTAQSVPDQAVKVNVPERQNHRDERTVHEVEDDSRAKQDVQLPAVVDAFPAQAVQQVQLPSEAISQSSPEEMSSLPPQVDPGSATGISPSQISQAKQGRAPSVPTAQGTALPAPGEAAVLQVSAQPRYGYQPAPSYPGIARRRGWEGTVEFKVRVLASGEVAELVLKNSSGYKSLDDAARRAIVRWRFTPAEHYGKIVESWVVVPVRFVLDAQARSR